MASSCTSSFCLYNPILLGQPQNQFHTPNVVISSSSKLTSYYIYCSSQATKLHAYKTKRKPRPSFYEQVRHKWSQKITPTITKFPWQEEGEKQQQLELKEGDGEEEEEEASGLSVVVSRTDEGSSVSGPSVSYTIPNRSNVAPWVHGSRPKRAHYKSVPKEGGNFGTHFGSAPKKGGNFENGFSEGGQKTHFDSVNKKGRSFENGFCEGGLETHFDSANKKGGNFENGFCKRDQETHFDSVLRKVGNFETGFCEGDLGIKLDKEKGATFGSNFIELLEGDKETGGPSEHAVSGDGKMDEGDGESGSIEDSVDEIIRSIELPCKGDGGVNEGYRKEKRSNTELAERLLPEHELKRLRNMSLRMLERFKVGAAGITQGLVAEIHEKWKMVEVVKLKFEEPLSRNMKRTHELLEGKTGGLVILRSGSLVVLYRGMTYKFQCVKSYVKQNEASDTSTNQEIVTEAKCNIGVKDFPRTTGSHMPDAPKYLEDLSAEEITDISELNQLLDELGPRFVDWYGCEPIPVDADLLPTLIPGYRPPSRLLPHGMRHGLKDEEMTSLRRIARRMTPHFALGRNRELQGLANSMVKLWERSAIAKIAIKRGVLNTRNVTMAEELKSLTGGTLLSRNKEYIVFYRGNDFLPPAVNETLTERQKLTFLQQDDEEQVRNLAPTFVKTNVKSTEGQLVAGTLTETLEATSRWGNQPSSDDVEKMMKDSALAKLSSLLKHLQNKFAIAKGRLKISERALAKLERHKEPTECSTDVETLNDEERFLFRKIGLSMKPYLLIGIRGVYDGTIENMHLHWKYREVVKMIVKRKSFEQVKDIAISLEAESGGVLVSVDKTSKGYAIILYRGKNYQRPGALRPRNLLTKRQALALSMELQRHEALKNHVRDLEERIELLKKISEAAKNVDAENTLSRKSRDSFFTGDDLEEIKQDEG